MNEVATRDERIAARINPETTKSMAVSNSAGGIELRSLSDVMEFSKAMAVADIGIRKHLRGNVGACFAICLQAFEWKLTPFAVANKSYLVNDQIAYEAQLVHAVILARAPLAKRPKAEYTGEGEGRRCKIVFPTNDGDFLEYESPLFSKIQPKNSPLWKNDPDQQLWYYSVRAGCRRHFPDVILGIYTDDELPADQNRGPGLAKDVTPSRTLSARLDALAEKQPSKAADEPAQSHAAQADHDPDTGEVVEETPPAATADEPTAEPEPDEHEDTLLDEARSMAMDGGKPYSIWKGRLTETQFAELQPHWAELDKTAKAADKAATAKMEEGK